MRLLDQRNTLITDRAAITAQIEQQARPIAFYSAATTASKSSSIVGGLRFVVLAGVLGALIGGALAYVRAVRRPAFFDAREPGAILGAPFSPSFPTSGADRRASLLPVVDEPDSAAARAFGFGAAALGIQRSSSGGGRFLLTSASADSGQSITAANLGLACAAGGLRTLVMDADLESRGLDQAPRRQGRGPARLARRDPGPSHPRRGRRRNRHRRARLRDGAAQTGNVDACRAAPSSPPTRPSRTSKRCSHSSATDTTSCSSTHHRSCTTPTPPPSPAAPTASPSR